MGHLKRFREEPPPPEATKIQQATNIKRARRVQHPQVDSALYD